MNKARGKADYGPREALGLEITSLSASLHLEKRSECICQILLLFQVVLLRFPAHLHLHHF